MIKLTYQYNVNWRYPTKSEELMVKDYYLNPAHIIGMWVREDGSTCIKATGYETNLKFLETPEEILKLIDESNGVVKSQNYYYHVENNQ